MDLSSFFKSSRVLIIAGKGGVGRTTVAATISLAATKVLKKVLILELEGKSNLPNYFDFANPLKFESQFVHEHLEASRITPDDSLIEYMHDHGLKAISKRLVKSGVIDIVSTAVPGIKDILVLGKIKQLELETDYELIIVDAPATGHTISFLLSAQGLINSARGGPVKVQSQEVLEMLSDPRRCQVCLVTLAEETPVVETIESAFTLEDKVGVKLGPLIVNGVINTNLNDESFKVLETQKNNLKTSEIKALSDAAAFTLDKVKLQQEQIKKLDTLLPLPQIQLPELFTTEITLTELEKLTSAFNSGVKNIKEEFLEN